jgi:hypothetical protein
MGPAGSAVTVSHVYTAQNLTGANPTISVTDTPSAGDVLVLISGNVGAAAISAVSGCGATWTAVSSFNGSNIVEAWIGTGATSSGTVTVTAGSTARAMEVLMVTGASSTGLGVTISGTGTQTTAQQYAAPSQLVIGAGWSDSSANALTTLLPATGWTVNRLGMNASAQFLGVGYRNPPFSTAHAVSATRGAGNNCFVSQLLLGDAASPSIAAALVFGG